MIRADFFECTTTELASKLLGTVLARRLSSQQVVRYRIVETEAYLGFEDPACHSFHRKKTPRVMSMYLPAGHAYVYLIYGMHFCLNVVAGDCETPEAVLIRALEPLDKSSGGPSKLTNGPGKLCKALQVSKHQDGASLNKRSSGIWLETGELLPKEKIQRSARIGIDNKPTFCVDWPLRFCILGNDYLSR